MKYTPELTAKISKEYQEGKLPKDIALELNVPERSIIAKLSSLGIYKRKEYLNKRGEPPINKQAYIDRIAGMLDISSELFDSMEKLTKSALVLLDRQISANLEYTKELEQKIK